MMTILPVIAGNYYNFLGSVDISLLRVIPGK